MNVDLLIENMITVTGKMVRTCDLVLISKKNMMMINIATFKAF